MSQCTRCSFFSLKLKLPVGVCIIKKRVFPNPLLLLVWLTKGWGTRHGPCKEIHFTVKIITVVSCVFKFDYYLLCTLIHDICVLRGLFLLCVKKNYFADWTNVRSYTTLTFGLASLTYGTVTFTLLTDTAVFTLLFLLCIIVWKSPTYTLYVEWF
jgi:hypothetical protein